jgi:hypothetical protein
MSLPRRCSTSKGPFIRRMLQAVLVDCRGLRVPNLAADGRPQDAINIMDQCCSCTLFLISSNDWRRRNGPLVLGISYKRPSLSWSKGGVLHYIFDVLSIILDHVICSSLLPPVVGQDGEGIIASLGFSRCCQCYGILLWPDSRRERNQLLCCS